MNETITGIHHVTAIASDPERNVAFYTQVFGMRMVKLTVNQDAPTVYHLYYGDELGRPGTAMTFFPWPRAKRGRPGTGQATAVSLAVPEDALGYWTERLNEMGIAHEALQRRFDEAFISLRDPDGLRLELVAHSGTDKHLAWQGGPVPVVFAIRGFYNITLREREPAPTEALLTGTLGFRLEAEDGPLRRYAIGSGGPGAFVDVRHDPDAGEGTVSAGSIHHVAWRTPNEAQHRAWREVIAGLGNEVTPVIDRHYFRSLYFREPGGALFELATDPPGFTVDEPAAALGARLVLPPWLEPDRERIERLLPASPARLIEIASGVREER